MQLLACPGQDHWDRLLHGRLGSAESETLEQHLDGCPACAGLVERLQCQDRLIAALRVRVPDLPAEQRGCLEELRMRLRQQLAPGRKEPDTALPAGVPAAFGIYRVVKFLGQGGMGTVYVALEPVLERHVAIKVIRPELGEIPHFRERFLREAKALAKLKHPNIVPIHYFGEEQGKLYLVMPLLEGSLLSRHEAVSLDNVVRLGLGIASGLKAAHEKGVLHRDLKPGNVSVEWLDGLPHVRLLDFGLACCPEPGGTLTPIGTPVGTPGYSAPEVCRGEEADVRSDLFSLGVILFELITGKLPYPGKNLFDYAKAVGSAGTRPLAAEVPTLPARFSTLIDDLINPLPSRRPADCGHVIRELEQVQASLQVRVGTRRRLAVWLGILVLCGCLGGSASLLVRNKAQEKSPETGLAHLLSLVAIDLEATPNAKRQERRYLTLAHRAGDSAALHRTRAALDTLPGKGPAPLFHALDQAGTVLAFDLAALGWDENTWREIRWVDPYGLNLEDNEDARLPARAAQVSRLAGCKSPIVRGDWLLFALTRPPLGGPEGKVWQNRVLPRGPWSDLVLDYSGEALDLERAARDLGVDPGALRRAIQTVPRLRDKRGLGRLLGGGAVSRQEWEDLSFGESSFQAVSKQLSLGTPSLGE